MLHRMKRFWNARHPDEAIRTNRTKDIWRGLKERLEPTCESEKCWIQQNFMQGGVNNELKDFTFAPEVPETWKKKSVRMVVINGYSSCNETIRA